VSGVPAATQPEGEVTLVFSDIEGSTRLLEELGADEYREALREHRRIVREAYGRYSGYEVDYEGDAFFFTFASARDAVSAVSEAMAGLEDGPIAIRVGIHTGTPILDPPKYVGMDVHFAARVMSSAHGGQVVLSAATVAAIDPSNSLLQALSELGEHRLKDIGEAVPLYQLGDGSFPPLKTISNTNLPRPASSFLGREIELAEVVARIEQGARLVTLTGPGGTGKTRLAVEAAATLVPEYKAGVFWVGLASLRDPALVTETIAQTLGAKDSLAEHVGERELLLLIDNLEQVIEAAPELSALLSTCPNLTLLVTSRELLRIQGEVEYPVPPLASPEAVALFCERSQLEPSGEIAELCVRLDSLPLAVELAAARTKVLSPAQILERLSSRLDLLKGGRDADPRQQTLRATIEWSYDLLSPAERQLFARLSVFAGGCTLEAAEEVVDADVDTLQSLVEQSLLRLTNERYWMLETIREFAGERLEESGDVATVSERHVQWILGVAEVAEDELMGSAATSWSARLGAEFENIRAAVEWSLGKDPSLVLRLIAALWYFLAHRGNTAEPRRWLERAWSDDAPAQLRLRVLRADSAIANMTYDIPRLASSSERRLELARATGDAAHEAGALHMLASAAHYEGDLDRAKQLLTAEVALHRQLGDELKASNALGTLGVVAHDEGDLTTARAVLEETLEVSRAKGGETDVAWTLIQLGGVAADQGDIASARAYLLEGIDIARRLRDLHYIFDWLLTNSFIAGDDGRARDAALLAGAVQALEESLARPVTTERERWLEMLDGTRDRLGVSEFQSLLAEGNCMPVGDAIDLAISSLD
jgi:predicted ATPase/class 3 adenylate cyclase